MSQSSSSLGTHYLRALGLRYPLTKPNGPKLSAYVDRIRAIEDSHWLTNYGPTNRELEHGLIEEVFAGAGYCLTVCNATIGLMMALKLAVAERRKPGCYVLMPSFTFAAAAHAVLWAGLTPLLVDIDRSDWAACRAEEERLLKQYGSRIAAIMPYATFGSCIDLSHYDRLSERFDVPIIVDAAASMGSLDGDGKAFGQGSKHTIIFSMHATKAFGVGECGAIYSADGEKIEKLRRMGNFGFDADRIVTMPGLNSKISEVVALSALIKLSDYKAQILHRAELAQIYRDELPGWAKQVTQGLLVAHQFMPLLLPRSIQRRREFVSEQLRNAGIGTARYFSPHIHQQRYFRRRCVAGPLPVTDEIAARIISLPISDFLTVDDVFQICSELRRVEEGALPKRTSRKNYEGSTCTHIAAIP